MKLFLILISTSLFLLVSAQNVEACGNAVREYSPQKRTMMDAKSALSIGHDKAAILHALKNLKLKKGNKELARKIIAIAFVRRGKKLQKSRKSFALWAQEETKEWKKNKISFESILKKSGEILSNSPVKPIDKMFYAEYLLKVDPSSVEGLWILRELKKNNVMPNQFGWFALAAAETLQGNDKDAIFAEKTGERKRKAAVKKRQRANRRSRGRTKGIHLKGIVDL